MIKQIHVHLSPDWYLVPSMYDFNCMSHRNFPHLRNYRAKEYFEHFVPSVYAVLFQLFSVFLPLPFFFYLWLFYLIAQPGYNSFHHMTVDFRKFLLYNLFIIFYFLFSPAFWIANTFKNSVPYTTFYHCFPPFSRSYLFNMYKNSNICDKIRIFIRKSF